MVCSGRARSRRGSDRGAGVSGGTITHRYTFGHLVKTLVNGSMKPGYNQTVTWNGLDEGGRRVPSGVYFYQLVTDELTATKKMVMLK